MSDDDESLTLARARIGKVLRGKYRIDRVLGIGGMAVVYAATHRNKKRFAIKMLHPELSLRENIRTRFLREGYVANSVEHPGAVAVLDDDLSEDGSAFVVMELLDGAPVDVVWERHGKRVPVALALSIGDALLDVLAAAHAKGVVHRDIKPANIFLTSSGELRVLDFGIARLHDETSSAASATQTGAMMGTPAYMAPEQALAEASKIDGQTDLWAVGATLFTLLTGELVHAGDNASQLLVFAATKKAREISSVSEGVPKKLGAVIDKALAFDKKERWATAGEMREALRAACVEMTGAPIAPLPRTERTDEPVSGFEETVAPGAEAFGSGSGGSGSGARSGSGAGALGFEATVDAASLPGGQPAVSTGAALSRSQHETPSTTKRAVSWKKIAAGGVALAAIAGAGMAYRAATAPRVKYCVAIADTRDGPRCAFETAPEALGKSPDPIARVTERGGKVVTVEYLDSAGYPMQLNDNDRDAPEYARAEVLRDDRGAVREVIAYDSFGARVGWQRWSEGGARIDFVDIDGVTPRTSRGSSITTWRRAYDAQGRVTRVAFYGPSGRPRASDEGIYGVAFESGSKLGIVTKETYLGADGAPAPNNQGVVASRRSDDGSAWGEERVFGAGDLPVYADGHHIARRTHDANMWSSTQFFGRAGEPVTSLRQTVHEVRRVWDPSKRTLSELVFDEQGRPQLVRDLWCLAVRQTMSARGYTELIEFLDGEGNRIYRRNGSSAQKLTYGEGDHLVRVEEQDPSDMPMLGAQGYARLDLTSDAHDNALEARAYDDHGRLTPTTKYGAVHRLTYDDRDIVTSTSNFDADDHPVTDPRGVSIERRKYDRLRNLVEVANFGTDGKPTQSDDGFSVTRTAYDDNDDLVSVSYFDASGAPTLHDGYSVHRTKYDERGLSVQDDYVDVHGDPVLIVEGYATLKTTRDKNGDVIEEAYFGKHGEPILREGGYALKKTKYDFMRRPIEVALFDGTGKPSFGSAKWSVEKTTYDERGLVLRVDHFDATGAPGLDADGRASLTKTWDSRANVVEETSLGTDGKPALAADGYATKKTTYDSRDEVTEEALFGADGKSVSGKDGWSLRRVRYDDFGNIVEESFFDGAHQPVVPTDLAYSSMKQRFDERHRLIESSYFDVRGAPSKGPDGVALVRYERDGYGRASKTSYFDGTGTLAPSNEGLLVVRFTFDDAGRITSAASLDGSGAPRARGDGCFSRHSKFDPQGHLVEESCLDAAGAPLVSTDGWAIRRLLHDAHGNDVDLATYAADGQLHADKNGVARRKNRFDDRNLVVETTYFDAAEKPAHDKRGVHSVTYAYDDTGKRTGESSFDVAGKPVAAKP